MIIVPIPIDVKTGLPASSIPAIAISTVRPETSTACPEVAAVRAEGVLRRPALAPLLALAAQVEERVVDADRHAHQQDHRVGGVRGRLDVADDRADAECAEEAREREPDRQQGGDERAEREQEDDERDRHGELLRLAEVVADGLVQDVRRAGEAELLDQEARMRLLLGRRPRRGSAGRACAPPDRPRASRTGRAPNAGRWRRDPSALGSSGERIRRITGKPPKTGLDVDDRLPRRREPRSSATGSGRARPPSPSA